MNLHIFNEFWLILFLGVSEFIFYIRRLSEK